MAMNKSIFLLCLSFFFSNNLFASSETAGAARVDSNDEGTVLKTRKRKAEGRLRSTKKRQLAKEAPFDGKAQRDKASKLRGVTWNRWHQKYTAQIRYSQNGKNSQKHLGVFVDPLEAAKVYDAAALKYHGEKAVTNFPAEKEPFSASEDDLYILPELSPKDVESFFRKWTFLPNLNL